MNLYENSENLISAFGGDNNINRTINTINGDKNIEKLETFINKLKQIKTETRIKFLRICNVADCKLRKYKHYNICINHYKRENQQLVCDMLCCNKFKFKDGFCRQHYNYHKSYIEKYKKEHVNSVCILSWCTNLKFNGEFCRIHSEQQTQ